MLGGGAKGNTNNQGRELNKRTKEKLLGFHKFCCLVIHHRKMNTGISEYTIDDMLDGFQDIGIYAKNLRVTNQITQKFSCLEKGFTKDEREEIKKFLVGKPPLEEILEDIEYSKEDEKEKKNYSKKDK